MKNLSLYAFLTAALLVLTINSAHAMPEDFADLSEKLLPTVVNVSTTTKIEAPDMKDMPEMPQFGGPFDQFFKEFYDRYRQAPQQDQKTNALGSGFVIDAEKGYIVTNNHVIKGADEIKITLHDNTTLDAELVGTDDKTDVALLKVAKTKGLVAAKWGDSDSARVGSWVIAIGNPFGLGGTVTAGIVSARQRDINAGPYDDFIQTDASINRGNSGGPMFNPKGEVIGVNTAIFSPTGGSVGIGFAVPANMAKSVVEQLTKYGKTKRGWIGVRIQKVTDEIAESLDLKPARGALIASVTKDGPSEKAGIKPGDVIVKFNNKDIDEMRNLPRIVAETEVGAKVPVVVWRKGKEITVNIKLGQLEKAEENGLLENITPGTEEDHSVEVEKLGLKLTTLNDKLRETYDLPATAGGVLVTAVTPNGPASEKGLAPGDVIAEIDQKEVSAPKDVIKQVEAAEKAGRSSVLLFVGRKNNMRFVAVKLEK